MPKGVEILKSQVKVFVLETRNQKEGGKYEKSDSDP